jgi:hypothetical protein
MRRLGDGAFTRQLSAALSFFQPVFYFAMIAFTRSALHIPPLRAHPGLVLLAPTFALVLRHGAVRDRHRGKQTC